MLYAIHDAFKTDFEKSAWKIKKVLKGAYYVFMTPQKREKITPQKVDLLHFHSNFVVLGMGIW